MGARGKRWRWVAAAIGAVVAAAIFFAARAPSGPRSLREFDADRLAELEVQMWQAYYAKDELRLFRLLTTLLHEQNRYSWLRASQAAFHFARAAAAFGEARGGYANVLPDLERGYAITREWTGAGFDVSAVARSELAWWVARRTRSDRAPARVGALLADEYALLYQAPVELVSEAALLRAEAGALRDKGGARADWPAVHGLLVRSYRSLYAGLHGGA
jgi:hypothetical protein